MVGESISIASDESLHAEGRSLIIALLTLYDALPYGNTVQPSTVDNNERLILPRQGRVRRYGTDCCTVTCEERYGANVLASPHQVRAAMDNCQRRK
jgi:hypothetical protein